MAAIRSSALSLALLLCACSAEPQPAPEPPARATASACEQRRFEGVAFTACKYDARRDEIALFLDGPDGRLRSLAALEAALGARAHALRFAMNAGMYDEDGRPIGLYVAEGRALHAINRRPGPGNFHLLPNGVLAIAADGRVEIVPSADYEPGTHPRWATQSGPMLVIAGRLHPAIRPNGDSLHVRNGVGVAGPNTAWFVISEDSVSFGRLARFFRDVLGCRDALYLDGSVSSLWDRPAGRRDGYSELGPLVAVFARREEDGR
jgi:uncharacterized protein YigE (DUF2233 family)